MGKPKMFQRITLLWIALLFVPECLAGMEEVFRWKQMGYRDLPTASADFAFGTGAGDNAYIAYNNVPMGVTHFNGRLFITMPRRRTGIPSTLNVIDLGSKKLTQSPLLTGYPSYEINALDANQLPNPDRIVSVYRTKVDACNRLWFIDTGMLEYPNNRIQVQRPSIWVMDLATNTRLHRFEIPESVVALGNGLPSITVDVEETNCGRAFAYMPDINNNCLYVYSLENDRIWTFRHNYFHLDPLYGDFNIAGVQFQWTDGVFSITLGPRNNRGFKTAYFHPMASISEFSVSTQVLQNETNAARSYHGTDFKFLGKRQENGQSSMHQYEPQSKVVFYAEVGRNAVGCWNTRKPFSAKNHGIVHQDNANMIYPGDLSVDNEGNVWVMTNTMPRFIYGRLNENEFNFRVWKAHSSNAIAGTVCVN